MGGYSVKRLLPLTPDLLVSISEAIVDIFLGILPENVYETYVSLKSTNGNILCTMLCLVWSPNIIISLMVCAHLPHFFLMVGKYSIRLN